MPGTNRSPPERRPERPVIQRKPGLSRPPGTAPGRRKTRFLAGGFTVIVHLLILAALLLPRASTPRGQVPPTSEPIQVSLIDTPKPPPPGPPDVTMVQPEAAPAPVLPHLTVRVQAPSPMAASDTSDLLSASQLAGAAAVGEDAPDEPGGVPGRLGRVGVTARGNGSGRRGESSLSRAKRAGDDERDVGRPPLALR